MNIGQVEKNVQKLSQNLSRDTFIYELLSAYGLPKASISRLQQGSYNLSKVDGEIIWKKKLYFRALLDQDLHGFIDTRRRDEVLLKHAPRFLVVTDFKTLLAYDAKTDDTLDIPLSDLPRHFDFFLPWAGMEKAQAKLENPADVKAAEKMAKLYDHIRQDNLDRYNDTASLHELNVFLSRLLFCYFAEDTEIFPDKLFTNSVTAHTQADGSDLDSYLDRLFDVLNAPEPTTPRLDHLGTMFEPLNKDARAGFPGFLQKFPYVNGGLFGQKLTPPKFSARSRKLLIECGSQLRWAEINPDIFGSMIQAVVHPDQRGGMGMHYTSVTNIMKVIEPLFLDELYEEFERHSDDARKLQKLIERLRTVRVFDPACGSGNFLIIAYKELRKLEMKIFERIQEISEQKLLPMSGITLSQFFGIELDDFAHEIAILSLWLAEHQMNLAFKVTFGHTRPSLPLREGGKIIAGNAIQLNWKDVCPPTDQTEVYLLGNPPYLGGKLQDPLQKADLEQVVIEIAPEMRDKFRNLDYIACWFFKGCQYIKGERASLAFVTTNSVCQGEQVELLWPPILGMGVVLQFARLPFKWENRAKHNAGVICVILGFANPSSRPKFIFDEGVSRQAKEINPYLVDAKTLIIGRRNASICDLPKMHFGNMARDDGRLFLDRDEYENLLKVAPEAKPYLRRAIGSVEYIRGIDRYCIWVPDAGARDAANIPALKSRFDAVREFRLASKAESTRNYAALPYRFVQISHSETDSIIIPRHSSEKRKYIPMGFLSGENIILDSALFIKNASPYLFGIITSRIHMTWVRTFAGRIKSDYRYSADLCYNNFPVPKLSETQRSIVASHAFMVLEEREGHSEKNLSEMYDPETMPQSLREAHAKLDEVVDRCYRQKPFNSDEERLEHLFKLYEDMTSVRSLETANA